METGIIEPGNQIQESFSSCKLRVMDLRYTQQAWYGPEPFGVLEVIA